MKLNIVIIMSLWMTGCATGIPSKEFLKLEPGMSEQEVFDIVGRPEIGEKAGHSANYYFYADEGYKPYAHYTVRFYNHKMVDYLRKAPTFDEYMAYNKLQMEREHQATQSLQKTAEIINQRTATNCRMGGAFENTNCF